MKKGIFYIKARHIAGMIALGVILSMCHSKKADDNPSDSGYPRLMLTQQSVAQIHQQQGHVPLFDRTLSQTKREVDSIIDQPMDVPVPKDMAGGYTHEKHKANFFAMQKAGVLYQITGEEKYAIFVRDMLLRYAKLFPTLGTHPAHRSYSPGILFWQCLNDANWLVYTSQAYDCVHDFFTPQERENVEKNLFRPLADHLSVGSPQFFNRIHNHSVWGIAAVGMIGIVMQDQELIDRSLQGLKVDKMPGAKDDDGGLIQAKDLENYGFLAQMDNLFSPDGYYTEGPYYQRYAMYPFMVFSVALQNNMPDLKIFAYRDSVLVKSLFGLLNLSDKDGEFFPINDAQKGMSYFSRELVTATDIIYRYGGKSPELLSIARQQGQVLLDDAGLAVAADISAGKAVKFHKKSMELRDGSNGRSGGIGILRSDDSDLELVMKYTGQGESHGHYDKLSFSLYHQGDELVQDYGLARFVNIEQKNGGGYLKENTSWAKQTIAHNTVVIDQRSNYGGDFKIGNKYHADRYFFQRGDARCQVVSAKDRFAYPGVLLHRTMALVQLNGFEKPVVLDIMRVRGAQQHMVDLPYYFTGQLMSSNVIKNTSKSMYPLGDAFGYQHLWNEGSGKMPADNLQLSWLSGHSFISLTSSASAASKVIFTQLGANDPEFNLRRDQGILLRVPSTDQVTFASAIEIHGHYDPVSEIATNAFSQIGKVELAHDDGEYTAMMIENLNKQKWVAVVVNSDSTSNTNHELQIHDQRLRWQGPFYFTNLKSN